MRILLIIAMVVTMQRCQAKRKQYRSPKEKCDYLARRILVNAATKYDHSRLQACVYLQLRDMETRKIETFFETQGE